MAYISNIAYGRNAYLLNKYRELLTLSTQAVSRHNKVIAEYIWIGGSGLDMRSKSRVLATDKVKDVSEIPIWSFDGSSTGQALGHDSEVLLKPIKFTKDPFRLSNNILVLCECLDAKHDAIETNRRAFAREVLEKNEVIAKEPWFGLEQEYTLFTADSYRPLGFPSMGQPPPQGQFYCGTGIDNVFGRHVSECHLFACIYCDLDISGTNAEVMPGSWEYQIGPTLGIDCADQLWIARYIMDRIAEEFKVKVNIEPKPMPKGDWNGSGCHCNFSTNSMRSAREDENDTSGGIGEIYKCMEYLETSHIAHMELYGVGNEMRMTGAHETARFDEFTWGIAHRGCSVRIPRSVEADKCGFFEDRRPAANCDPYDVTGMIAKTCILDKPKQD